MVRPSRRFSTTKKKEGGVPLVIQHVFVEEGRFEVKCGWR